MNPAITKLPTVDALLADIGVADPPAPPEREERCDKTWLVTYSCAHCTGRWGDEPVGGSPNPFNYLEL